MCSADLREKTLRGLQVVMKSLEARRLQGAQLIVFQASERTAPAHARMFMLPYCAADALDSLFGKRATAGDHAKMRNGKLCGCIEGLDHRFF